MGRKWLDEDFALLKRLYLVERLTAPEIAEKMGRDKGAVRMKITSSGLAGYGA